MKNMILYKIAFPTFGTYSTILFSINKYICTPNATTDFG